MSSIAPRAVEWLWEGRLPAGEVVSLEGIPSAGKSTLATEIVACVTTGRPLYGASPSKPRAAIWIGHEEGLATALRPRLDAAGADASRVFVYEKPPSFPADYDWLESEIRETEAAIVIIDPIDAYVDFGLNGDSHRNGDVRARLRDLSIVAQRTGVTVVMIRHFRKSGGVAAVYRSAGSLAYSAIARATISVVRDPGDPNQRLATWSKLSDAPEPSTLVWTIDQLRRVQWIGVDDRSADEVIRTADARAEGRAGAGNASTSAIDEAVDWLECYLEPRGWAPAVEVLVAATRDGIAEKTLKRAKERARVRSEHERTAGGGRWIWVARGVKRAKEPEGAKDVRLAPSGGGRHSGAHKSAQHDQFGARPERANAGESQPALALSVPSSEPTDTHANRSGTEDDDPGDFLPASGVKP
jgi:hypothetical protein